MSGRRLPEFLRDRPMPYWAWLRRLALQRLIWWRRFHLGARKRTCFREGLRSVGVRVDRRYGSSIGLAASGTSPSGHAVRDEERSVGKGRPRRPCRRRSPGSRAPLPRRPLVRRDRGEARARLERRQDAAPPSPQRLRGLLDNLAPELKVSDRISRRPPVRTGRAEADGPLADWIAEIGDQIAAGESVDLDALAAEHPDGVDDAATAHPRDGDDGSVAAACRCARTQGQTSIGPALEFGIDRLTGRLPDGPRDRPRRHGRRLRGGSDLTATAAWR